MVLELLVAVVVFALLMTASIGTMLTYSKLPVHHRQDETNTVVRLVANIFVVMTSLVFGLMINSSKNTFAEIDKNVHAFATQIILLDRTLRTYGLEANETRKRLENYVENALSNPVRAPDPLVKSDRTSELALNAVGDSLALITPTNPGHVVLWNDARQQYQRIVEQRWIIVEQSEGVIPRPLITMLTAWLTLIFASFGYRAPRNVIVVLMFFISALLISLSIFVVLDMDVPFAGWIEISDTPLRRALAELQR
ncbi:MULTISPECIES: DUF4239 domain-containing protein [Rhizobium]|uniref:bestrophin-like domain n=1 Tax=Rhizobium TaxID=379 RepID=UPI0004253BAD|nr:MULTISPECIES: DUF4239 domain-containing protein [Rhizobium]MCA0803345.1 DUF4239 domain-containing protein [Rhizobium sp. T1473]MCS0458932.1 DUF4239 domain-containing protein [Rhizobium favelukesii]UFS83056.1 DUF4239 domain-containing protein [Rhizobium sp. T136]